jgi:FkbM family methyltransferase
VRGGRQLIIYGTGKMAACVAQYILSEGLLIYAFCDEDRYYYKGKKVRVVVDDNPHEIPVIDIAALKELDGQYNVLLGMIDYGKLDFIRSLCPHSPVVEYLDVVPGHMITQGFAREHRQQLEQVYCLLEDEESRQVMEHYIMARLTGDVEPLCQYNRCAPDTYDYALLSLTDTDVVVDGGAFTGDTITEMESFLGGRLKHIYAFEPDEKNYELLCRGMGARENVTCFPYGLWNEKTTLRFGNEGTMGSKISEKAETTIRTVALDDLYASGEMADVTVIKMDIEGSELEALHGAEKLIEACNPKLAICIYHKNEDIINIPMYLSQRFGYTYKFYLRHHSNSVEETVLYGVPKGK